MISEEKLKIPINNGDENCSPFENVIKSKNKEVIEYLINNIINIDEIKINNDYRILKSIIIIDNVHLNKIFISNFKLKELHSDYNIEYLNDAIKHNNYQIAKYLIDK